jgi:hypothetical protein
LVLKSSHGIIGRLTGTPASLPSALNSFTSECYSPAICCTGGREAVLGRSN